MAWLNLSLGPSLRVIRTPDAKSGILRDRTVSSLMVRAWSLAEWLRSEAVWERLLTRSNADA